jgi:membrane protein DedA with SNARE-associated domain
MQGRYPQSIGMFDRWLPFLSGLGGWAYVLLFSFAFGESIAVIGLLVPGATFTVIFGFLASQGMFDIRTAAVIGAVGAILGDMLSFVLGRRGIDPAKRFPTLFAQATIDRAEAFMKNYGVTGVFLGRFIGPLRPFVPFVAGALKMRWRSFMVMNVTSGVLWSVAYLAIGFFFGQFWASIHRGIHWIGVGLVVIVLGYIALQYLGERRRRKKLAALPASSEPPETH